MSNRTEQYPPTYTVIMLVKFFFEAKYVRAAGPKIIGYLFPYIWKILN